jgi:hypothetical protein
MKKIMQRKYLTAIAFVVVTLIISCSKKHLPQQSTANAIIKAERPIVIKPAIKKLAPVPVARVIVVNDKVAKKNIDGRLYYDVEGRRYWRNYNDGKYYLFNKSMYADSAFRIH